jgi:hypothetical protein
MLREPRQYAENHSAAQRRRVTRAAVVEIPSKRAIPVCCFMRRDHVSALERGARAPDLINLLVLAHRLDVAVVELIDGLPVPVRRVGSAQVLALIISTDAIAASLGMPFWYVSEIVLYLQSVGALAPARTG